MSWTSGRQPLWQALHPQADEYHEELRIFMDWLIETEWQVRDCLPPVRWLCSLQVWMPTTSAGWGLRALMTVNIFQETVNKLIRLFDEEVDEGYLLPDAVYTLRLEYLQRWYEVLYLLEDCLLLLGTIPLKQKPWALMQKWHWKWQVRQTLQCLQRTTRNALACGALWCERVLVCEHNEQ